MKIFFYHFYKSDVTILFLTLFLLNISVICSAEQTYFVNVNSSKQQQVIKGWGGNIYPNSVLLGDQLLNNIFQDLPSQYMRVFSEFPKMRDANEIKLYKYLNSKNIDIIINIRLNSYVLNLNNMPEQLLDYIGYLNNQGISIKYLSLNEPDGVREPGFEYKTYIRLIQQIKLAIKSRNINIIFIGPDTAYPNVNFINQLQHDGILNAFDILTYHSYEYTGVGFNVFKELSEIGKNNNMPIWINEQNFQANTNSIFSIEYALKNMLNLFRCINDGRAELSLFFSYAWGSEGGVVLFDKGLKVKPIYFELQKLYKNVPSGSIVLSTQSDLPCIAFKSQKGITLFIINDSKREKTVKITIDGKTTSRSLAPMSMDMFIK